MKRKLFQCLTISILAIVGACKEEDPQPVSVDGQMVFWTHVDDGLGIIEVTLDGKKRAITMVTSDYGPACGQSGFANYTLPAGTYSFTALELGGTGQWQGEVTFVDNECRTQRLLP